GKELDLLTTMLPTLLFVIGISGTVHLVSKYAEEVHFGTEKFTAIKRTIKEVGLATFLTSFTTAIGFFSLITMDNVPVREFGIYTGVGVLFTYVVAILLLPAVMVQLPPKRMARTLATPARFWRQSLTGIFTWSLRNYRWVLVACAGVVILSIFGLSRVRVDNYFLDDLQPQSGLYQDLHFFQDNFSGIRPFEMSVDLVDTSRSLLDLEVVRHIETVETYLREKYGAGFLLSPATIVKATHQTINGGMAQQYRLPDNEAAMKKVATNLRKYNELRRLRHLITEDLRQGRITGKMDDIGSEAALAMNADLNQFVAANTDPELVSFKLTGAATLMDNNSRNITGNLVLGLSLALLIIGALMGLLFRSWKMVVISLVPNILPLLIIGSVLGFFDVHLRVSTSLVFTIAFGIAVDDTIHFLSKLKIELRRGRSFVAAARNTFLSTGKAIILTSLILTSGFSVFLWSEFQGTFIIGSLICLTLLIAVVADLFLLPALLLWMFGDQESE
ncbi:MAG: MMPL family transporter, partial [Bacteroidota bacterium]